MIHSDAASAQSQYAYSGPTDHLFRSSLTTCPTCAGNARFQENSSIGALPEARPHDISMRLRLALRSETGRLGFQSGYLSFGQTRLWQWRRNTENRQQTQKDKKKPESSQGLRINSITSPVHAVLIS